MGRGVTHFRESNDRVKPSEQCKAAGLKSLAELVEATGTSEQTLINWHRDKPKLFDVVIAGAVAKKNKAVY